MAFRDEDMDRMALEDTETPWTVSELFLTVSLRVFELGVFTHWVELQSSFTTGLPFSNNSEFSKQQATQ